MSLYPYTSPIDPSLYPFCAFLFCVIGIAFFATFIVSEITASKKNIVNEVVMALVASCSLGTGIFFVFLMGGIYL